MKKPFLLALALALGLIGATPPAHATFPGTNGRLVFDAVASPPATEAS